MRPYEQHPKTERDQLVKRAYALVDRAINAGRLARANTLVCVDCGEGAECYDHRDYHKPLSVDPVCRKCNNRRGPGVPLPTKDDGRRYKHDLGKHSGKAWSNVEGGEGFSQLSANLPRGMTLDDIETREAQLFGEASAAAATRIFERRIARAEYFKRRDPWY